MGSSSSRRSFPHEAAAAEVATLELQNSKLREEQLQAACDERDAVVGRLTARATRDASLVVSPAARAHTSRRIERVLTPRACAKAASADAAAKAAAEVEAVAEQRRRAE